MQNIFVAGHNGMVGRAIVRQLAQTECKLITRERSALDLCNQAEVHRFFAQENIDKVYLAAARVGGIWANNTYPADFIYENLMIQANVIHAAHLSGVQHLLCLGSSCIYPKHAAQPMAEAQLLTGPLEPTNEPYAIAKIAGIKLCESYNRQYGRDYRAVMPTNLYGAYDNFHPEHAHVIPALLRRFDAAVNNGAEEIVIWGSGRPKREFLHVDDMARASIFVMNASAKDLAAQTDPMLSHINVGTGKDCSIKELAEILAEITGFKGRLVFDKSKPDGAPRKWLDTAKLTTLGWQPEISLREGLQMTYSWFKSHQDEIRG